MAWRELTRQKRDQIASRIPPEWQLSIQELPSRTSQPSVMNIVPSLLSAPEQEITDLTVPQLLESLRCGRLTARETLAAFCHRAALAHQLGSLSIVASTKHLLHFYVAGTDSLDRRNV